MPGMVRSWVGPANEQDGSHQVHHGIRSLKHAVRDVKRQTQHVGLVLELGDCLPGPETHQQAVNDSRAARPQFLRSGLWGCPRASPPPMAARGRRRCGLVKLREGSVLREHMITHIRKGWSPRQISGTLEGISEPVIPSNV